MDQKNSGTRVIERGNIYFFYRPKVGEEDPAGTEDIQRFHVILAPKSGDRYRLLTIGRKTMPRVDNGNEKHWGFVDKVGTEPEDMVTVLERETYTTKTRGTRERPEARPAGEGVYALVRHGDHTHLAYSLELPRTQGEVQKDLHIEEEASYILSVKNPEQPSPTEAGLRGTRKAKFPKRLQESFGDKRFSLADPPELLDFEGAEFILMGGSSDPEQDLGIRLSPQKETAASADIFTDLHLERERHPTRPLFEGRWT